MAVCIAELNVWMFCLSSLEARDSEDNKGGLSLE